MQKVYSLSSYFYLDEGVVEQDLGDHLLISYQEIRKKENGEKYSKKQYSVEKKSDLNSSLSRFILEDDDRVLDKLSRLLMDLEDQKRKIIKKIEEIKNRKQ